MKNKFLNLLFLFCSLVMITGYVRAEADDKYDFSVFDPENYKSEENKKVDYSSVCSKYTNEAEKLACCNQDGVKNTRIACKSSIFKACTGQSSPIQREQCCAGKYTGVDFEDCRSYVQNYCDVNEQVRLSKAAAAIKVEYEPVVLNSAGYDDPNSELYAVAIYALDVKIYNLTNDVYIVVERSDGAQYSLYSKDSKDGVIILRDDHTETVKNYSFKVYSNSGICEGKVLRNIKISTPRYNQLSNREACVSAPSYYKCQEFVNYDFEVGNYVKDVEEYKAKLAKQGIKDPTNAKVTNKGVVNRAVKKVSDHKWLVLGIVLAIGCVLTIVLLKKRSND